MATIAAPNMLAGEVLYVNAYFDGNIVGKEDVRMSVDVKYYYAQ